MMPLFERPLFVDGLASALRRPRPAARPAKNGFAVTQPPVLGSNEQIFGEDKQVSGRRQSD
jgi:hypothetical protein